MFERLNTPQDAFNWQLSSALKMEREILDTLDELIGESNEKSVADVLRSHREQTHGHVQNVERVFELMGWEADESPCPVIEAIEKEGKANIKKADEAIVDSLILAGAAETEHHEIAVYENLITLADAMGQPDVVELLTRNLSEEQDALLKVASISRTLAGATPLRA